MPVLEATEFTPPRSALRHRPIGGKVPSEALPPPVVKRASRHRPHPADTDGEVDQWQRAEDGASSNAPSHRIRATTAPKTPGPGARGARRVPKRHVHPLLYLGLGMLGMLVLWTGLVGVIGWFNTTMDDLHYGRPRTFQTDQFVGHNESGGIPSHFIVLNLHGHIEIIEFPGGDASHARIFLGPQLYTDGSDLVPVTLKFLDVNGDHRPDMIITFQNSRVVFINDQATFRPLRPEERHQVEDFLQHHGQ